MREKYSDSVVNYTVIEVADSYLESAKVLMDAPKRQTLAAFILAALSVEIYLKSFLVKRKKIVLETFPLPNCRWKMEATIKQNVLPGKMRHELTHLFDKIKNEGKAEILLKYLDKQEEELVVLLQKYEGYFLKLRYFYEENAMKNADSGVIELAEALNKACYSIINQQDTPTMSR